MLVDGAAFDLVQVRHIRHSKLPRGLLPVNVFGSILFDIQQNLPLDAACQSEEQYCGQHAQYDAFCDMNDHDLLLPIPAHKLPA
jgi:hypothetical protein